MQKSKWVNIFPNFWGENKKNEFPPTQSKEQTLFEVHCFVWNHIKTTSSQPFATAASSFSFLLASTRRGEKHG